MTWFRIDDGFSEHAKVDALGADQPLAVCAWTLCGVTCSRKMTDGFVSTADLSRTLHTWSPKDRIRAADALVRVGLWTEVEGGWLYHDWLDRNPSRDETMAKRAAVTERQRRARGGASRVTIEPVTPSVTQSVTRDKSVSHAPPSRPVPSRPVPSESLSARPMDDHPIAAKVEAKADVRRVFIRLYAAAYRAAFSDDWLWAPHEQAIDTIAGWCSHKADPAAEVAKVVAGAFGHEPWKRHRYPPKWIAEDPAACVARASERSHQPDDFSHASTSTESPF